MHTVTNMHNRVKSEAAMCTSPAPTCGICIRAERNPEFNNFEPLDGPISIGFPPVLADRKLYGVVVDNDNLNFEFVFPAGAELYNVSFVYRINWEQDMYVYDDSQDSFTVVAAGTCHSCVSLATCSMHGSGDQKLLGRRKEERREDVAKILNPN